MNTDEFRLSDGLRHADRGLIPGTLRNIRKSQLSICNPFHPCLSVFICGFLSILCGCAPTTTSTPIPPPSTAPASRPATTRSYIQELPKDPAAAAELRVCLDVYRVILPFRTVSASEDFWRRADEECVDQETHQRLFDNGLRVGRSSIQEWSYFRDLIAQYPATTSQDTYVAAEAREIGIEMKKDLLEQTLFFFAGSGRYDGHNYQSADNILTLGFRPTPRKEGSIRVTLCPTVRSQRRIMQFSPFNNEERREIKNVQLERRFELNLRADIPLNSFLIVAPSAEAKLGVSVGAAFLLADGETERQETVILLVPRVYKWEQGQLKPLQP